MAVAKRILSRLRRGWHVTIDRAWGALHRRVHPLLLAGLFLLPSAIALFLLFAGERGRPPAKGAAPELYDRLAEAEAARDLAEARAEALSGMVERQRRELKEAYRRLASLQAILEARKGGVTQFIDGRLTPGGAGGWRLDLTLVRGGNHLRPQHLWLQLFADGRLVAETRIPVERSREK